MTAKDVTDTLPMEMPDATMMPADLCRLIPQRDDSSFVTVVCDPAHYSASSLAHAVEDVDVHLVDLLSRPADGGRLAILLRVRTLDPTAVIASLQRYGYDVEGVSAPTAATEVFSERLASLQALMNV